MKRSDIRAALLVFVWAALSFGLFGSEGVAAADGESAKEIAMETAARKAQEPCDKQPASMNGDLTLFVESSEGGTRQLTYARGDGWKFDSPAAVTARAEARVAQAGPPQGDKTFAVAQPLTRPTTVFIDGPTGYTYVWVQDQGWKFIGRLADRLQ